MADRKSKAKNQVTGKKLNSKGEQVAEDGGEVTKGIEEVYEFDGKQKEENQVKEYKNRAPKEAKADKSDGIKAEALAVPKKCEYCYLQDKCPHYDKEATCYFRTQVGLESPKDMVDLVKTLIEIQGERVLFGRFIEETEGGYPDKNLSDEIQQLMNMMNDFKQLLSEQDEISIRVKGKNAVESTKSSGILSQIFGGGGKENDSKEEDSE